MACSAKGATLRADFGFDCLGETRVLVKPVVGQSEFRQAAEDVKRVDLAGITVGPHPPHRSIRGRRVLGQQPDHRLRRGVVLGLELLEHPLELGVARQRGELLQRDRQRRGSRPHQQPRPVRLDRGRRRNRAVVRSGPQSGDGGKARKQGKKSGKHGMVPWFDDPMQVASRGQVAHLLEL